MPDEALALREYLGHIIKAATVTAEVEFLSAIPPGDQGAQRGRDGYAGTPKATSG
jgi:hypothetical protein